MELHYVGISAAFDPYAQARPVGRCAECGAALYDGDRVYYWSTAAHAPEAAVHDILRDDFNMKKPTAGPLGQGGKYRVI